MPEDVLNYRLNAVLQMCWLSFLAGRQLLSTRLISRFIERTLCFSYIQTWNEFRKEEEEDQDDDGLIFSSFNRFGRDAIRACPAVRVYTNEECAECAATRNPLLVPNLTHLSWRTISEIKKNSVSSSSVTYCVNLVFRRWWAGCAYTSVSIVMATTWTFSHVRPLWWIQLTGK